MADDKTTDFGFEQIPVHEKVTKVSAVFSSVASKYDIMNDLMSGGVHRIWKQFTIELSGVRAGHHVLDVAGGTGDLAIKFARLVGSDGKVVLADINSEMLAVGRDRLTDLGALENIDFIQADAQSLPFVSNTFDCISIAFGLRNITDKNTALISMLRVLKPGGRLLVLEFSKPGNPLLSKLYDTYSFQVLPRLGKLIANDSASYKYLAESIRMHPDQQTLKTMMIDAGFQQCSYHNLSGGIVAIHRGTKA